MAPQTIPTKQGPPLDAETDLANTQLLHFFQAGGIPAKQAPLAPMQDKAKDERDEVNKSPANDEGDASSTLKQSPKQAKASSGSKQPREEDKSDEKVDSINLTSKEEAGHAREISGTSTQGKASLFVLM